MRSRVAFIPCPRRLAVQAADIMLPFISIRFSTPTQERGSSRERQLEECCEFVRRMGWPEPQEIIEDLGVSAWKGDHLKSGNLGKWAKRVFAGEIPRGSVLVVENLDRLSRQKPRTTLRWMEDICDHGISIACVRGGKVYDAQNLEDNIMDIFDVLYQAKAANDYSETLSKRVAISYEKRREAARQDGTAIHSRGPAWLRSVGKRPSITWEPITERVTIVREILDLTCDGVPPWTIARMFNERGTPSFSGGPWERTYVVKIIRHPALEGDYVVGKGNNSTPTGEVLHGYYGEPVAPVEVIAAARVMLASRRRGSGRNSGSITNLFGQRIRCGRCDGRMMTTGYESRYLVCFEANRGNGCTHRTTYKYRPFEAAALDSLLPLALDDRFFRQAERSNDLTREIAETERAIRSRQSAVDFAFDLAQRTKSPTAERRFLEAEADLTKLRASLDRLNQQLQVALGAANAQERLERVVAVRDALTHPQDDIRLPARLRVTQALQAVVDTVTCDDASGQRRFTVTAIGGLHASVFDNAGKELGSWTPVVECTAPANLRGSGAVLAAEAQEGLEVYATRRRAQADIDGPAALNGRVTFAPVPKGTEPVTIPITPDYAKLLLGPDAPKPKRAGARRS